MFLPLRLITLTSTLIIQDITKTSSNNLLTVWQAKQDGKRIQNSYNLHMSRHGCILFSRFVIRWQKKHANKIHAKFVSYLAVIGLSFKSIFMTNYRTCFKLNRSGMCEDVSSGEDQFGLLKQENARCLEDLKLGRTSSLLKSKVSTDFVKIFL